MKRNFLLAALIVAALFLAPSCGKKSGNTGLLVPEDAAVVVHVNSASLSSKLSWAEIRQSNWFKELARQEKDSIAQQLLQDPTMTGIDDKADLVVFIKRQGKGSYAAVQGSVKDAGTFEAFLKKIHEGKAQIKTGDISSAIFEIHDETSVVSWDKKHFVVLHNADLPQGDMMMGRSNYDEERETGFSADSLSYFANGILTMKKKEKLDKDSRFATLVKDGKDIHLWLNNGELYGPMMNPMLSMMGDIASLMKDNIAAVSFNFDNGKITLDSRQYYGAKLTSFFSKYNTKAVSTDVVARIPSQNVVGALAFNYPPEAIKEFLKITNLEGMVSMAIARTGYSVDEFVKANKGEVVLAVSDLTMTTKTDTISMEGMKKPYVHSATKPDMKIMFATSVNDKAAFEKLITLIWDQTKNSPVNASKIANKLENNWFAAGNSQDQVDQFLAGKSNNKSPFVEKISGHPMGFYIDVQKILQVVVAGAKDSTAIAAIDLSLKTWQDVHAYGGEFKDKAFQFHAEINMVDKNTNSLKQLNTYLDNIYLATAAKRKRYDVDHFPVSDSIGVKEEKKAFE